MPSILDFVSLRRVPAPVRAIALVLAGWVAGQTLGLPRTTNVGGLYVSLDLLPLPAFFVASFCVLWVDRRFVGLAWALAGSLVAVLPALATRMGSGGIELARFEPALVVGSLVGSMVVAGTAALCSIGGSRAERLRPVYPGAYPVAVLVAGAVILAFRIIFVVFRDVPNEERSLFLGGVEIHHLVPGLVLALLLVAWSETGWRPRDRNLPVALLFGLASGFYLDECTYVVLYEVSDAAYGGPFSLWGGLVAWAGAAALGASRLRRTEVGSAPVVRPRGFRSGGRWIIGHRGARGLSDENTLEAVETAAALGLRMVEIDVGLTSDGELVLMHDSDVRRTTNGRGRLDRLTAHQVSQLVTSRGFRVPTLAEVLRRAGALGLIVFVDLKRTIGVQRRLLEVLDHEDARSRVILDFERFDEGVAMKRQAPDLCVVVSPFLPFYLSETAEACGVDGVDIYLQAFSADAVERLARRGFVRTCWYTSSPAVARRVLGLSIDGLMSDHPDRLLAAGIPPFARG